MKTACCSHALTERLITSRKDSMLSSYIDVAKGKAMIPFGGNKYPLGYPFSQPIFNLIRGGGQGQKRGPVVSAPAFKMTNCFTLLPDEGLDHPGDAGKNLPTSRLCPSATYPDLTHCPMTSAADSSHVGSFILTLYKTH